MTSAKAIVRRLIRLFPLLIATVLPSAWCSETQAATSRPNILFIFTDDQRWDTVAALGNPEIKTPTFDALVERGTHFTNAYCMGSMVGAVCLPSRTMLITGRSLWRIPENPRVKQTPPGMPLLPVALREAGYVTFHCGKRGNACTFGNAAFDENIETDGRTATSATENADHALKFLKNHDPSRPFFMYLAPPVPHDPCLAPERFQAMYDPAKLTLSDNFMGEHPFDNGELKIRDELLAAHPRTREEMRQHLAGYYATISHLDYEMGRVIEALRKRGLLNDTIVILSSDQGLAVGGRHGLMGKQNLYEHVKPPLVFTGPGIPQGKSNALVYLFDLFPTICEFAGAKVPESVEGRSLVPNLHDHQLPGRPYILGAYRDCQRMIRDARWKLMEYDAKGARNTQLFDLANDPGELHNLAGDTQFSGDRTRLESLLAKARSEFGDPIGFGAGSRRK